MRLLLSQAMVLLTVCTAYADVEIVRDGAPLADIVVPAHPLSSVSVAAKDLQHHLELISGAQLPIVTSPSKEFERHIYVGESDYTRALGLGVADLKAEGFRVIAADNYVFLAGRDEQRRATPYDSRKEEALKEWQDFAGEPYSLPRISSGLFNKQLGFFHLDATATLYAVSEFLEQLGVRWYSPYEDGTVIPTTTSIVIPDQRLQKEPAFPYRAFLYYGAMRTDAEGVLWFKRLKYGASYLTYINHTTMDILGTQEQREAHPEYYAKQNGAIVENHIGAGVPKLASPGFRDASLHYLDKVFSANASLDHVALGMPDGFTRIDEDDAKIWDRGDSLREGKYSDYVWDYWVSAAKELKKTHPDKYLAGMAYTTYREPPSQLKELPDNVSLTLCLNTAFELPTPQGDYLRELRSRWLAMLSSKKLFIWEYYRFYAKDRPKYPVFFTRLLQDEMRTLNGRCEGKFIEIYPERLQSGQSRIACPGLTHMLHYLQGKLFWDPDLDREKLLEEYYELYYGPAKSEMKAFYEYAEEVWMRPESRSVSKYGGFLKEADVTRYFDLLKQAREKAGPGTVYDRRVAQIEAEMEPLKLLFGNLERTGPNIRLYEATERLTLDGDLEKPFWSERKGQVFKMGDLVTGKIPETNQTSVSFRYLPKESALAISVVCKDENMDKLRALTDRNDDPAIFKDDAIEIYLETAERSFFKIVVNANGAVLDESKDATIVARETLPILWSPGIKVVTKKEANRWTAEIWISTGDFGELGPEQSYPWGINVCRMRFAGGTPETYALSPTGKQGFFDLSKLANLALRK